jgi:hypothetical protein
VLTDAMPARGMGAQMGWMKAHAGGLPAAALELLNAR